MARVLVADDEGSVRTLLRMTLQLEGHEVLEAEDGRFALRAIQDQGPFDLLVLDLMMPGVDGWEVLRHLDWEPPKVIVLTGREDPYAEDRTQRTHPVHRYIVKPYEPADLLAAVQAALEDG